MYTFRFIAGVYARCQNAMEKLKKKIVSFLTVFEIGPIKSPLNLNKKRIKRK